MATVRYHAVVHCDRCGWERWLVPAHGIALSASAFAVANWLHDRAACGHTHPWDGNGGCLLMQQDDIRCIQCCASMGTEQGWLIQPTRVAPFLPNAHISVHYLLCPQCTERTGGLLCPRQLTTPHQCKSAVERWMVWSACACDWRWYVLDYLLRLLRRDGCCIMCQ
jgi:hypothetical protein